MAGNAFLLSTILMGFVVVLIGLGIRSRGWKHYRISIREASPGKEEAVSWIRSPTTWALAFVVLAIAFSMGGVLFVQQGWGLFAGGGLALTGGLAAIIAGYVVYGVYQSARTRGFHHTQAIMIASWAFGSLTLLLIVTILIVGPN